jgi:hypothetical protein
MFCWSGWFGEVAGEGPVVPVVGAAVDVGALSGAGAVTAQGDVAQPESSVRERIAAVVQRRKIIGWKPIKEGPDDSG